MLYVIAPKLRVQTIQVCQFSSSRSYPPTTVLRTHTTTHHTTHITAHTLSSTALARSCEAVIDSISLPSVRLNWSLHDVYQHFILISNDGISVVLHLHDAARLGVSREDPERVQLGVLSSEVWGVSFSQLAVKYKVMAVRVSTSGTTGGGGQRDGGRDSHVRQGAVSYQGWSSYRRRKVAQAVSRPLEVKTDNVTALQTDNGGSSGGFEELKRPCWIQTKNKMVYINFLVL